MVFAILPHGVNRIMQIMLLCLISMLLPSNNPWQKEMEMERHSSLKENML